MKLPMTSLSCFPEKYPTTITPCGPEYRGSKVQKGGSIPHECVRASAGGSGMVGIMLRVLLMDCLRMV